PAPPPGGCGRRTNATAAPTCPGAAATAGGGTSASNRRTGRRLSCRRSKTATCCCPTRRAHDDRPRAPWHGRRCPRRRFTRRRAAPVATAADSAGPGQDRGIAHGPQHAGAGRAAGRRPGGLGLVLVQPGAAVVVVG